MASAGSPLQVTDTELDKLDPRAGQGMAFLLPLTQVPFQDRLLS